MQRQVLSHADVKKALAGFVTVQLDLTRAPDLARRYGVFASPTFLVLRPDGAPVHQVAGYVPVEPFIRFLRRASGSNAAPP